MVEPGSLSPAEHHYVQDDTIEPTVSHATSEGKVFTSRSALYEHYRQHGFECSGGQHNTGQGVFDYKYKSDLQDIRNDVAESLRKIKWGMAPVTEKERERCLREERDYQKYKRSQER